MCVANVLLQILGGFFMDKKILTFLAVFVLVFSIASVCAVEVTNHDFDGLFKMDIPKDANFTNPVEEGQFAPMLSAKAHYESDNMSVYYYDESCIVSDFGESNVTGYVPAMLKSNSVYMDEPTTDGDLYIWNTSVTGGSAPSTCLVGISSDDDMKMVCIEGENVDDLKSFADSVEF